MATGGMNLTTWKAKRLVGDSGAAADALIQSGTGVATDIWLFKYNERSLNSGVLYQYTGNNNNDQLKFIDNGITISKSTTTSGDNCAYLRLAVIDTDIGAGYEQGINVLKAYHTHVSTETGMNVVLNSGKNLFIGSGNAADGLYNIRYTASQSLFIASDNNLFIEAGASTIANRVGIQMDSSGNIIPVAAEVKNDNDQDLGASDARFKTIYSTTYKAHDLHLYGSVVGNTASDMISGTAGLFSQGDTGPKITFGAYEDATSGQVGSLIFTDNDTAGTGVSWHFVSNQSDWNVTSKRFHARSSISVGTNLPVTTQALNVSGLAAITNNGNTVTIGSQNSGFCHFSNSANVPFYFDKGILMAQGCTIGSPSYQYRPFQLYLGRISTSGSNALNSNNPLIEFCNSDRSQYCQLIYDDWDSLCAPDSLSLVGNQNGTTFIMKNGPIWIQGGSNAGGNINRLNTSSGMPGNMQYNTSRRGTQIYSNGIAFADPYNGNTNNDAGWIRHIETTANDGYLEIAVGDDGGEKIYVRQYNTSNNIARTVTLMDGSGYSTFIRAYNAVWNDYAECREAFTEEPGRCITETSLGKMMVANKRLLPGCKIISDTYGTCMGETANAKTPIAVAGRVLAYPYRACEDYELGAAVCSAPGGTVDIMTREEIMMYPERIIGTVSEIPNYDIWYAGQDGKKEIPVNGRIWIYVK